MTLCLFGIHNLTKTEEKHIKVGFIFVGDEITPYTNNFIKARNHIKEVYGDRIECVTTYNVTEGQIEKPLQELIDGGCDYIIAASYGYGPDVKAVAKKYPNIQFCVPTGDNANEKPVLSNYHNCFGEIYQGRYVCGKVAGMKIKQMIDENIITKEQFVKFVENSVKFEELMMMYRCAIREVQTKLEILNDEFKTKRQRNPIDSIRSRIKSPLSIYEKLKRRNHPISIQSIADNLNDVAGIRVVCPFISDIYDVARMLISQDDVEVMEVKDYIKNPKPNGYRSLHYVVIIPIFLSSGKEYMKVEVQIRTIAMNFWASLEHQMHYKQFDNDDMPEIVKQLTECAENIYHTDVRMQEIREDIHKFNE